MQYTVKVTHELIGEIRRIIEIRLAYDGLSDTEKYFAKNSYRLNEMDAKVKSALVHFIELIHSHDSGVVMGLLLAQKELQGVIHEMGGDVIKISESFLEDVCGFLLLHKDHIKKFIMRNDVDGEAIRSNKVLTKRISQAITKQIREGVEYSEIANRCNTSPRHLSSFLGEENRDDIITRKTLVELEKGLKCELLTKDNSHCVTVFPAISEGGFVLLELEEKSGGVYIKTEDKSSLFTKSSLKPLQAYLNRILGE